ncbi:hypothetical protein [Stappia indica]|uniref:hypothetical protein n=1 Tax=Stappia indica TaxID=538381 RepID=UPI001CD7696D|nr:hypothetical protein [Stappia indica]MCA1300207.1 hypothetical protein [Stappia indica]
MEFEKTRYFRLAVSLVVVLVGGTFIGLAVYNHQMQAEKTYMTITGGGFIYNYRHADIHYGITAAVQRPTPTGLRLIARFENPTGGQPITLQHAITARATRYSFETPPVQGVKEGHPYKVTLTLEENASGKVIETHERHLVSDVDPGLVPDSPLTIGPGYHRNPERERPTSVN